MSKDTARIAAHRVRRMMVWPSWGDRHGGSDLMLDRHAGQGDLAVREEMGRTSDRPNRLPPFSSSSDTPMAVTSAVRRGALRSGR
jgi:hypothetical protein